jgi:hypothetical protein
MAKAKVNESRPENQGFIRWLASYGSVGGLHPEILDRLIALAAATGCERISYNKARVLVHKQTGVIVGCGLGMAYFLRLAGVPQGSGLTWSVKFSDGERLNVRKEFGPGWFVGDFHEREAEWLRADGGA